VLLVINRPRSKSIQEALPEENFPIHRCYARNDIFYRSVTHTDIHVSLAYAGWDRKQHVGMGSKPAEISGSLPYDLIPVPRGNCERAIHVGFRPEEGRQPRKRKFELDQERGVRILRSCNDRSCCAAQEASGRFASLGNKGADQVI
jgi:hypothetical protein